MLTVREKEILSGKKQVSEDYFYKTRERARKKARKCLESLMFLAQYYPESIKRDDIVKFITTMKERSHGSF
jgi:hypothetical protein